MRRPRRLGMVAITVMLVGCGHVIHPAAVTPGPVIGVAIGVSRERHEPYDEDSGYIIYPKDFAPFSSNENLAQLNLSWGWRRSQNLAWQVGVSGGTDSGPLLDGYLQFLGAPIDVGVGVTMLFLFPGTYVLVGREFLLGGSTRLRLDLGARYERLGYHNTDHVYGPQGLLGIAIPGFEFGLWAEGQTFSPVGPDNPCDDACVPSDLIAWKYSVAFVVRVALRGL